MNYFMDYTTSARVDDDELQKYEDIVSTPAVNGTQTDMLLHIKLKVVHEMFLSLGITNSARELLNLDSAWMSEC